MPIFGGSSDPGSDVFRVCPECGEDEIFSRTEGILSKTEYLCNHCGYEAEKSEVRKSFDEVYNENKKKNDEIIGEKLEKVVGKEFSEQVTKSLSNDIDDISDPELKQQVEDRKVEGWEIEEVSDSGEKVIMSTTKGGTIGGHALAGILTGLSTFGVGNVAYDKLSKKKNKERIVLRADAGESSESQNDVSKGSVELMRELKQLHDEGLITDDEFEEKKQNLLDEM
ncbi:SHOCT domain-containing protein [Haloferax sulfurifontis]|uniref:SHOCT domain-containing protein n=1 Tax=Haloferax sulfurifontis TaxID=255616 RepID=A0A830E240_9EURY|nr:SHOCT domain-containing protein [Haloferax sulfurifontis]GGC69780.1 hypothetical protein GCM10007209_34730 [Haloferax sulfurifontis]